MLTSGWGLGGGGAKIEERSTAKGFLPKFTSK